MPRPIMTDATPLFEYVYEYRKRGERCVDARSCWAPDHEQARVMATSWCHFHQAELVEVDPGWLAMKLDGETISKVAILDAAKREREAA